MTNMTSENNLKSLTESFENRPGQPTISTRVLDLEKGQREQHKRLDHHTRLIDLLMEDKARVFELEDRTTRLESHLFLIQQIENLQKRIRIKA